MARHGKTGGDQRMSAPLIHALDHPLRRRVLREMHKAGDALSPVQLSKAIGEDISKVSYHVQILVLHGAAVKTGERAVRGARENFYTSKVAEHRQAVAILADTKREDDGRRP